MQSFHLRGDLDEVAAAVSEHLGAEGFTLTENEDVRDPSVRRISFYTEAGWVGLAEERFAAVAEWGPALSQALATEVVTLDGECDHAFYTHVLVHEKGAEKHAARVPEDITLDDDGRHRLRAKFLPGPIVVDELGGEENMRAIGEVMGIPRPLFHAEDEPALTLYFEYTSDAPPKAPDFGKLLGAELAGMAEEIQSALGSFKVQLAPGTRAIMGVRAAKTDGPPRLVACHESNSCEVFAGEDGHVGASFLLEDAESARGLVVSLYGDGLAMFEAKRIRARVGDREWTADAVARKMKDGLVTFALPEVVLTQPTERLARPDTSKLPFDERLRQGMKRLGAQALRSNPAEVTVWIEGRFVEPGEGELAITAQLTDHADSAATTDNALKVKPAVRRPLVPAGAPVPHPVYVESYEARHVAFGWVAFDAPWTEVRDTVMQIAREAEQVLAEATGKKKLEGHAQLRSGDRLTLKKDVWKKVEEALLVGANVSVEVGDASIDLAHEIDGPNFISGLTWRPGPDGIVRRPPAVSLCWWCPRPDSESGIRALARLAERALQLAAKVASNVGGLASAQEDGGHSIFDTAYDRLAGLTNTNDVSWLRTHARGPGWRVLLPPGVGTTVDRLVKSPAPDPFAYSPADAEAMERLILPLLA